MCGGQALLGVCAHRRCRVDLTLPCHMGGSAQPGRPPGPNPGAGNMRRAARKAPLAPPLTSPPPLGGAPWLQAGVDVVVTTPGRAAELIRRGALSLAATRAVVLDEVDVLCGGWLLGVWGGGGRKEGGQGALEGCWTRWTCYAVGCCLGDWGDRGCMDGCRWVLARVAEPCGRGSASRAPSSTPPIPPARPLPLPTPNPRTTATAHPPRRPRRARAV